MARKMKKYIDADRLKAEIERLTKTYQDSIWRTIKGETAKDFRDKLLSVIDSLQEEQPIDKNILTWRDVNELERIINKVHYEFPHGIGEEAFGKLVLERFIDGKDDVQEQQEVDLEKEIEEYFPGWAFYTGWDYDDMEEVARHFFNLGLNAKKEE